MVLTYHNDQIIKFCLKNHHMNIRDWNDIGYNFLVGEDGKAYQGCGWGKEGAHSISFNSKSIRIYIIGDYRNKQSEIRWIL